MPISEKSRAILQAIAKGHTYEQILVQDLAWTYHDIFLAAAEALDGGPATNDAKSYSVEEIRHDHPRAYEKWSAEEDGRLTTLFRVDEVESRCTSLKRFPAFTENYYAS